MASSARIYGMNALKRALSPSIVDKYVNDGMLHLFIEALLSDVPAVMQQGLRFAIGQYSGAATADVRVVWDGDTSCRIVASGQNILFVEFGSGITYPSTPNAAENGFGPLTWSSTHKNALQESADGASWIYKGDQGGDATEVKTKGGKVRSGVYWTHGNRAAGATYFGVKELHNNVESAARAVFGGR